MDELKAMHELSVEWGCITNLIDRIMLLEDTIKGGWPELDDMISNILAEEGTNKDPQQVFFNVYTFMLRLYFRMKANPVAEAFNKISYSDNYGGEGAFIIQNYDYDTFLWAIKNGFTDRIDNNTIYILAKGLSPTIEKALRRKIK